MLGFGLWAMIHRAAIHTRRDANRLFLSVMAAGVAARLLSLAVDGSPSLPMYFFLVTELIGAVLIFSYTRRTLGMPPTSLDARPWRLESSARCHR